MAFRPPVLVRPPVEADFGAWLPLWDSYNSFYNRVGASALSFEVTRQTWSRFLNDQTPVCALLAECEGSVVGLVHFVYHRSTSRLEETCYLQDLFTVAERRGQGIGRALIEGVYGAARKAKVQRVYWHTHQGNAAARRLYDQVARDTGFVVYVADLDASS